LTLYTIVVGDIKCILDEVLDVLENFTDGLLNALRPSLKGIIQDYSQSMCSGSFQDLGLCLDPDSLGLDSLSSSSLGLDSLGLDSLDLDSLGLDGLGLGGLGLGSDSDHRQGG
jgi:hypothetical protein